MQRNEDKMDYQLRCKHDLSVAVCYRITGNYKANVYSSLHCKLRYLIKIKNGTVYADPPVRCWHIMPYC